jgi:hypothetical protein
MASLIVPLDKNSKVNFFAFYQMVPLQRVSCCSSNRLWSNGGTKNQEPPSGLVPTSERRRHRLLEFKSR